jgi:enoyl-CoA hydratase/carnithine racemase
MPTGFAWEFTTQYQKSQWEDMDYRDRIYTDALYDKVNDQIARITFNRPEKRNALNDKMYNDMLAGLHQANDDPAVRVVIMRGNGNCFGAGHELSSPKFNDSPPVSPDENPTMLDYYGFERRRCSKYEDIMHYPKITIAQVHGNALGAHEIIAHMCDYIIAAEHSQFGMRAFGERPFGINRWAGFPPAESQRLWARNWYPEKTGPMAEAIDIINQVVPDNKLEEETLKLAKILCRINPEVLTISKEWIGAMMDMGGLGSSYHAHYVEHNQLQYVRFRPDETNFYKTKKGQGVGGYIKTRTQHGTKV